MASTLSRLKKCLNEQESVGARPRVFGTEGLFCLFASSGLMISGFAQSGAILGKEEYVDRAVRAADFVQNHLFDAGTGKLLRSCYRGQGNSVDKR